GLIGDALLGGAELGLGLVDAVDRGLGGQRLRAGRAGWRARGRRTGVLRRGQGGLGLCQLLRRLDDFLLGRDGRFGVREGILTRSLQVGARFLDVADGGG